MENDKISREDFNNPEFRRREQMKVKTEAVWVTFLELGGLINVSKFASDYMERSQSWFVQKLNGLTVGGKKRDFTKEECGEIAASLRKIARRLDDYADAIDKAE